MTAALHVDRLTVGFATALVGPLSFSLPAGAALAVLGPNGAGKTTLLRTCLGLMPALAGQVCVGGAPLPRAPAERAKLMAYVPQRAPLAPGFSVRESVAFGRTSHVGLTGKLQPRDHIAIDAALAATALTLLTTRPVATLSGGEQQRVLIARALATGAHLLMLDEPMNHLDMAQQGNATALLASLKQQGFTLVFTTHNPNDALALADFALLLSPGQPAQFGATCGVITPQKLTQAFATPIIERSAFVAAP
jgi:iron complex transport system ATP-binding protein